MKKVLILGSTGSIGTSALEVVRRFPDLFKVVALVASTSKDKLIKQAHEFKPEAVCLTGYSGDVVEERGFRFFSGFEGLKHLIDSIDFDVVVSAIPGSKGILPTYWVSQRPVRVAIANKEAIVCAGRFIFELEAEFMPVDSEHSAVFQAMLAGRKDDIKEVVLTASGGPFWNREDLDNVKVDEALRHPRWRMGKKITIDSATLMNKGFEVIEACVLFDVPIDSVSVMIHPESIVHSLVKFVDNSIVAQLSKPDMRIPIAYAISYPQRLYFGDCCDISLINEQLTFYRPDMDKFKCLQLAYEAYRAGYPYPIILNAADEVAVNAFLRGIITFLQIPEVIEMTMGKVSLPPPQSIDDVFYVDKVAHCVAEEIVNGFG